MPSRVVITGLGVVSPIGHNKEAFWRACLEGRSGVRKLESPWVLETGLSTQIGALVEGYEAEAAGQTKMQANLIDRVTLMTIGAAREAVLDAGFTLDDDKERKAYRIQGLDPTRIATVIGSGIGGLTTLEVAHGIWRERKSKDSVKRYSLPMMIPNAPAGQAAIQLYAKGECKAISTACAAGTMAIGDAWRLLRDGEADLAIAGGAEAVAGDSDGYAMMGFDRLKTMSTRNEDPTRASRPFDRDRDGFVLGEGAGIVILEREEHAKARGARIYAYLSGYASNCDAWTMMQPDESGEMIVSLMQAALRSAKLAPESVDHISCHATSTVLNDKTEAKAIRALYKRHADRVSVTGLKSMTGHCIAASGAFEVAATALSFHHGSITPTINYEHPDPDCDVDVVANRPRAAQLNAALKLSYGFGGHNACLVLTRG